MIDQVLQTIAPHHCYFCDTIGRSICQRCEQYIDIDDIPTCVECVTPLHRDSCRTCKLPYSRLWVYANNEGQVAALMRDYKTKPLRDVIPVMARLLYAALPQLPGGAVFVPIPTLRRHVRERGVAHAEALARHVARQAGGTYQTPIVRVTSTVQRGSSRSERLTHAVEAFQIKGVIDPDRTYVIVDDVITTGASIRAAASLLREAGARDVWVLAFAH